MSLLQALVLGAVQGATEFLPISSSGHLALGQYIAPGISQHFLLFEVVVHLGTLCAIGWVLRARIRALVRAALSWLPGAAQGESAAEIETLRADRRWVGLILIASVPTALIGLLLKSRVEQMIQEPAAVGVALLCTALILVLSERIGSRERGAGSLRALDALLIGSTQGLAVIPGISRSGATIGLALCRGVSAEVAVEFSLLISLPAVLGASALIAIESLPTAASADLGALGVGFLAAFGTGIVALNTLRWAVTQRKLLPFGAYCGVVGVGAIALG